MTLRWGLQLSSGNLTWGEHFDTGEPVAPNAPTNVIVVPTGGHTAYITIVDNTGGTAEHRWQIRPVDGVWVDAVGGTNMSFPGTDDFYVTELLPATQYEVRVLAWLGGLESAWAYSSGPFWTDNTGGGESENPPPDLISPTMEGSITVTDNTTGTSCTLVGPIGTDDSGSIVGYELSIDGEAYYSIGSTPEEHIVGQVPNTDVLFSMRCYDAGGNRSNSVSVSVHFPLIPGGTVLATEVWSYVMLNGRTAEQNVLDILAATDNTPSAVWTHPFVTKLLTVAKFLGLK